MMKINIQQIQAIENEMLKETVEIFKRNHITFFMCGGSVLGTIRHSGPIPWDTDMDIMIPLSMIDKAKQCLKNELSDRFCIDDLEENKNYKNLFPRVAMPHTSSDTLHIDLFPIMGLPDSEEQRLAICRKLMKKQRVFLYYKHMRYNIAHPTPIKNLIGRMIEIFCSPFSKKQLKKQFYKIVNRYPFEKFAYAMHTCGHNGEKNIFAKSVFGTPQWKPYCDIEVPIPEQWDFYLRRYYKEYMNFPPEEERKFWLKFELDIDERDYEKIKDVIG